MNINPPAMSVLRRSVSLSLLFLMVADGRVWTNTHGRTFEADYIGTNGTKVVFRLPHGKHFEMPLLELSDGDRSFVRNSAKAPIEDLRATFGRPWPRSVSLNGNPECKIISENREKGRYIYESPGYRFHCDARITRDALSGFVTVFESTRAYLAALPISLMSGETLGTRSQVLLFGEKEAYFKAGGMPGSAGCFVPKNRLVLIPMDSLGLVKGGTGFSRDMGKENRTLIHELVHQLTPNAYFAHGATGWFSEGLAEYVAATPYHNGHFMPDIHGNAVKDYVTAYGTNRKSGRNLGTELAAPKLRDFMLMDYRRFAGENPNLNYGLGLLVTHYFFHMEGGGKARRITEFLKGLHAGKYGEESLAPLLGGGSFEKLEAEISGEWAKKGVKIRFGN